MKPNLGRARRPRPLVVLTTGWCGEQVLVRLLAAGGTIRSSGYWLERARRRPEAQLRSFLRSRTGESAHLVLVQPAHLWAVNDLDLHAAVARLADDGITLASLERRSAADSGLSRAICGAGGEVLPTSPQVVETADLLVHGSNARGAAEWLDAVVPPDSPRLVFEDDLVDHDARARTVATLADHLSLDRWIPPAERDLPTATSLWELVANPEQVRSALVRLAALGEVG